MTWQHTGRVPLQAFAFSLVSDTHGLATTYLDASSDGTADRVDPKPPLPVNLMGCSG